LSKIMDVKDAVSLINDGDSIVVSGCENLLVPEKVLSALENRFLETGRPRDLTEYHPVVYGMGEGLGLEHFAHKGMVKRAVGSGFSYLKTSRMTTLVNENKIEAYVMPMGTVYRMLQNVSLGERFTLTDVGIGTFVDPRREGGRMNSGTTGDIVSAVQLGGKELLCYENPRIDAALIRAHTADEEGNLSFEQEPVTLGVYTMAMAARACGGKVVAQVKRVVAKGSIHPKKVYVPGIMVDAVVVEEEQAPSGGAYNPFLTGENTMPLGHIPPLPLDAQKVILRRAAAEIGETPKTVNLGVGIPASIPKILVEENALEGVTFFTEHGSMGGIPADRSVFGTNINPVFLTDPVQVFQAFRGGLLDVTFLGCAQMDRHGNVNVSKFNGVVPGCGGFIDIAYKTKKLVFCGTFSAGGVDVAVENGAININKEGRFFKLVPDVEQVTLNGREALKKGQSVLFVTERCVFMAEEDGLHLIEVAPGVDVKTDILAHIPFDVRVDSSLKTMDERFFRP